MWSPSVCHWICQPTRTSKVSDRWLPVPSSFRTGATDTAGPAELEMVEVGEADVEGAEEGATLAVGVGVGGGEGLAAGFDAPPRSVPTIQPTMTAGTRSATRIDRWPILVRGCCSVTNLL